MAFGKRVPPLVGRGARLLHVEDTARGLLLEPLARVALMDPCGLGQIARCEWAPVGERSVEAEPIAEVDAEEVPCSERRREEALNERVALGAWVGS